MTDVVWLILDSLSYSVTPFANDDLGTMPAFKQLADEDGVVYSEARVPGLFSASSHGSFFTGYHPSETGMHYVHPHFPGNHQTIAQTLSDTHDSFIITDNPFVHKGLSDTFDYSHPLKLANYQLFNDENASLADFEERSNSSSLTRFAKFALEGGKPVRSVLNGLSCALHANLEFGPFQTRLGFSGEYISKKIEKYVTDRTNDSLVVANYMDLHPPFDPSDEALERFLPDVPQGELPINISGEVLQSYSFEQRIGLLKASAWDLDKHLGPLLETLLAEDAFVVVTADHGHGFNRQKRFEEERIHVPLVIFSPDQQADKIKHTVNIIDLPATTMDALGRDPNQFPGKSLLEVEGNRISITESIRTNDQLSTQIDIGEGQSSAVVHDILGVAGQSRVEYVDGSFTVSSNEMDQTEAIKTELKELLNSRSTNEVDSPEYSDETLQRLKDFGYLSD
ncbi:sulfatase-like hydrolase/transferase [Haloarcula salina]|uniref:sulfatase-like hydrolase/transferase n=1 Tax=Haloarcula salina TaxID=1429914 RepID=UPI003C6F9D3E